MQKDKTLFTAFTGLYPADWIFEFDFYGLDHHFASVIQSSLMRYKMWLCETRHTSNQKTKHINQKGDLQVDLLFLS